MRKMALILAGVWLAAGCTGATRGEMVVEWWGKADCARHKGMKIEMSHYADGVHGLWFDLSELKRGTRVYHASLRVHTKVEKLRTDKRAYMSIGQGVFYYDPCGCTPNTGRTGPSRSSSSRASPRKSAPCMREPSR